MPKVFDVFIIAFLTFLLLGCNKSSQQAEIEKRAQELVAERQRKEELAAEEATKIAHERERLAALQQEQREKVAADLSARAEQRQIRIAANMEQIAAEQARREGIAAEVKAFIDDLRILESQVDETKILRINGQASKEGALFASPTGLPIKYIKREGDNFVFEYDGGAFKIIGKKTSGGLSIAQITDNQPLRDAAQLIANQVEGAKVLVSSAPASNVSTVGYQNPSVEPPSPVLTVLKATYGAGNVQRDVKSLVQSKIKQGRLNFNANSREFGGDPIFGEVKTFYIKYMHQGRLQEKSFREGEPVSIP